MADDGKTEGTDDRDGTADGHRKIDQIIDAMRRNAIEAAKDAAGMRRRERIDGLDAYGVIDDPETDDCHYPGRLP